ncbi:MAG: helicase-related protein, partial [Promethearchaeota archaeon]
MIESEREGRSMINNAYLKEKSIEKRDYQLKIAKSCASKNSLVVLPTGLGKTIIGVFVAALILEKFPEKSKIIVLAPTRPLINQHYESFVNLMSIPKNEFVVLTGKTPADSRVELFETHQIIFYTPQTLRNDLVNLKYSLEHTCLVIFDEAHHASGDYAYNLIADKFVEQNPDGIILGLTASPGASKEKIRALCENLHVPLENIHTRTRKDADVQSYLKPMDVYKIGVNLTELMADAYYAVQILLEERLQYLSQLNFINSKSEKLYTKIIRKDLLKLNGELTRLVNGDGDKTGVYSALSINAQGLILFHMLELIEQQGLDVLLIYLIKMKAKARKKNSSKALKILARDHRLNQIFIELKKNEDFSPQKLIHPKYYTLESLLIQEFENNPGSRVLVFVKLRDSVKNIVQKLKASKNRAIKPSRFVGQSTKSQDDKGMSQKQQLEILEQFKKGQYNVLVSTNVGEEGLDIAECDLVVFYDVVASEIRFIQRKGRTARHREGKVIILYCKGTHDEIYMHIALTKLKKMNVNLKGEKQLQTAYSNKLHQNTLRIKELQNIQVEKIEPILTYNEKPSEKLITSEKKVTIDNNKKISKVRNKIEIQSSLSAFLKGKSIVAPKQIKVKSDIKINVSFPVKFGLRKKFQKDGFSFEIVKSILDLTLFDKVLVQIIDPRGFDGDALLKKYILLSKKYNLIVSVFDFVDFKQEFDNEEKLLKKKFSDWGDDNKLQAINIDLSEELYFIL